MTSFTSKPFTYAAVIMMFLGAALHLLRIGMGWTLIIGNFHVPVLLSVLAAVLAAGLGIMAFVENLR